MHFPSLAELIVEKSGFSGNLGMILGSGLSSISNELTNTIEIPYQDLNGFPIGSGVYFIQLESSKEQAIKKCIILRN